SDDRVLNLLRHGDDRLEVAVRGNRKTGLDNVDAHLVERLGDLELFLERHRGAGGLLAVPQGGVEDEYPLAVAAAFVCLAGHFGLPIKRPGRSCPRGRTNLCRLTIRSPDHPPA